MHQTLFVMFQILVDLIKSVKLLLNTSGQFIFEEPYLGSMYQKTSYDQIYDEHIFVFSFIYKENI